MDLHQRDSLKNEKKEKGEGWGGIRGRGEERTEKELYPEASERHKKL